jgi:cobalt-precorrin 5A hydrolase
MSFQSFMIKTSAMNSGAQRNEKGILEFCSEMGLAFCTISRDEIRKVEDRFESSDFVRKTVGVGSVAEACAVLGGQKSRLICGKTVYGGITLALAEEEGVYYI